MKEGKGDVLLPLNALPQQGIQTLQTQTEVKCSEEAADIEES